ncbi:transcriptional regulator [Paenibacillus sp. SSG-1]|uniref:LysR family transcriptional regulator n=1 Tax=Paenibacillus sp. SSG-1 TaxID=1443669 RepID=UPI000B7C64A3|nr:LysR family transcriptional regulator [Paenibacillus sp. SSG-1]OXL86993.1 transcriptional regulator [Paenibacillus sp. SSG-1]
MDLKHLHTFRTVADTHGFTKAAEILSYAQSSVTAQIQALEEEVGSKLFDRLGKKVQLTTAGERLLPYAIKLLELHDRALAEMSAGGSLPSGTLNIGAPESLAAFRLPDIIKEYTELYPDVKIILRPAGCKELKKLALSGDMDLVFVLEPEADDPHLQSETLIHEPMALIAPPAHPLTLLPQVDTLDLKDVSFIHTESDCSYRLLLEQHLNSHAIYSSSDLEFWSIETIKHCVMSGLGISLLPAIAVKDELSSGRLIRLPWDDSPCQVATQMLYHPGKWLSPALGEFIRLSREHAARWRQNG